MSKKNLLLAFMVGVTAMASAYSIDETKKESDPNIVNGLNKKTLENLAENLKKDPKAGKATFYSDTQWTGGMKSLTNFSGYKIDGNMKKSKERKFTLYGDEMLELGGTDTVPGAIEEMMYAVGTCIVAAANANAAVMGVKLTKIDVALESDIDMHGLMNLDPKVRPGVLDFRTVITIGGDADEKTLKDIAMSGYKFSPVSDTVRNGVELAQLPKIIIQK